jgi:hypothetical protein
VGKVTLKVIAAEGCRVEVGPEAGTGTGAELGGLIPGRLSNEKEQAFSNRTNKLARQSSLRVEERSK